MTDNKRIRRTEAGFVGVNLAKGGDMTLYNRLQEEAKATTMNMSLLIRLALIEYFEKRDGESKQHTLGRSRMYNLPAVH